MIYNDDVNNAGNNGNRGKFSDRLKKIRKDRLKLNEGFFHDEELEESFFKRGLRNIFKVVLALPMVVYSVVRSGNKKNTVLLDNVETKISDIDNVEQKRINRKIKVNKIKEIDIVLLKKQKEEYIKERRNENKLHDKYKGIEEKNQKLIEIKKLQKEIIDLIKKKLVNNINELEVLHSELYLLKEITGDDIYLKDCQENISKIKKLLSKINSLKMKYDYLKDNIDFEYILEYNDDLLIDKILELKDMCADEDIKYIVDNYKILDEFKFLYLKIDKLQEDTIKYEDYKIDKEKELKDRDINFDGLKIDVYDIDKDKERYDRFVKEQEIFLMDLESKISSIEIHEKINYRLKGFNQLLGNSIKYLGLFLVNPLKDLFPGIAVQTMVTKNIIHNLYNNLEWEEDKKIMYDAIDYSFSINVEKNNLDSTLSLVNSTLEDIIRLKNKYNKEFSKYQQSFSEYRDVIKKINKIENAVIGSKIKIELIQQRLNEKEKQNIDKMRKVKKLNSSMNN